MDTGGSFIRKRRSEGCFDFIPCIFSERPFRSCRFRLQDKEGTIVERGTVDPLAGERRAFAIAMLALPERHVEDFVTR